MKTLRELLLEQARYPRARHMPTKGIDPEKQRELHEAIVSGKVDIGPMPNHLEPVEDRRPSGPTAEQLGQAILSRHNGLSTMRGLQDNT